MDNERIREICLALPHAAETLNWGHHLVYWVGDREWGVVVPLRGGAISRVS